MQDAPDSAGGATLAARLNAIHARIAAATQAAGRPAGSVTLVAVSKTHGIESVQAAIDAGQAVFGENRVQEAARKFTALRVQAGVRLHLIGGLQTNKAHDAVAIADMIESLDRPGLADALARAGEKLGRLPELLVQVNTGDEPQKSGVARAGADGFIAACKLRFGTALRGLMCVPPATEDPAPHFRWLADRAAAHDLPVVSMGMSADFELAIACGATLVRVGSAIFGTRLPQHAAPA
jgi:pyridoxal phosphate enzyme (YggS family)